MKQTALAAKPCCASDSSWAVAIDVSDGVSGPHNQPEGLAGALQSLWTMMIYSNSPHLGEAGSLFSLPVTAPQDHC